MAKFKQTVGRHIIELLKDNLGSTWGLSYFYGDPQAIGQQNLPACIVVNESTFIEDGPTGEDQKTRQIRIKIVTNKKDYFLGTTDSVGSHEWLEGVAEGVDDDDSETSQSSILGILRKNRTLESTVLDAEVNIEYLTIERTADFSTDEAHLVLRFTELTTVTGRS